MWLAPLELRPWAIELHAADDIWSCGNCFDWLRPTEKWPQGGEQQCRIKNSLIVACAAITATILMSTGLHAQQGNVGKINGTVVDSSGAAVTGAEVVVTNQATTLTQSKVTGSAGDYDIELLPVGTYTVTVTMSGFRKEVKADIPVLAGQTVTVDFKLQVGATTQTITVTGAAPVVDATDATQGTTRVGAEISNLPMVLRPSLLAGRSICSREWRG